MAELVTGSMPQDVDLQFSGFHNLMPYRVETVLLVSSLYESFILEEEGLLTELITSEYLDMHLSHAPRVMRVSTGDEALEFIKSNPVDLVIPMTRLVRWNLPDFARAVKELRPDLPVVVLAGEPRELARYPELAECQAVDRRFVWTGDAKILLAIIKFVEDLLNAEHDTRVGDVRIIVLVENSVRFYSAYLPLIYGEVVKLTRSLIAEGINRMQQLLRMRARPKILLAESFEEACDLYHRYRENLLGVISDIRFPRSGVMDNEAGLRLVRLIREDAPYLPVLLQSSDATLARHADDLRACFLRKNSPSLLQDLRNFLACNFGFGDFVFVLTDGREVARAHDLQTFEDAIANVPDESLIFHARHNHLSNWLMARTEFALAARIRPRQVTDFATVDELRGYLGETFAEFRERNQSGVIADFSPSRLRVSTPFTRIGSGSIGGKARGLAFVNALIRRHGLQRRYENIRVFVPSSAAIGTDVFDAFLDQNDLHAFLSRTDDDQTIADRFLDAKLPGHIYSDLMAFLRAVQYPLAVRSSSLLEDSQDRPFAGIYCTHMIANNHRDIGVRLDQLCDAIKLVYASTFFRPARRYREATGRHAEEEKMAVILQEIVGSTHHGRFYPTFSGVVRSYNYYPAGQMKPEDGIASVALGLGKMVVEGGQSLMFSPALPQILPQYPTTRSWLSSSQRELYAVDIATPETYPTRDGEAGLVRLGLDAAETDGTLAPVGSVYSAENDRIYDGVFREGPRLVTFAHILKSEIFPLARILNDLLEIGVEGLACPVEIEFAVDLSVEPREFAFLQVRPIVTNEEYVDAAIDESNIQEAVCYSEQALGHGRMCDLRDVVYVKPESFDAAFTREMASRLATINDHLVKAGRKCVLIGPGRWGSTDRWLGIPVTWDQISSAQVIVETTLSDFVVTPSQGTHFFQNLTSLGVGYLTVDSRVGQGLIDWDWLAAQPVVEETEFLRHIQVGEPLDVRFDGRNRLGVVLKPTS